jgi:phenylacetate-CoA ligase
MKLSGLRIGLVGPLAPPSGGMASQTAQLAALLRADGAVVKLIQVNPPYRPAWITRIRFLRAVMRLLFYVTQLWSASGTVDLFHVMANSGWSWHLYATPAIWIGWLRGKPVVLNYRGGEADIFFTRSAKLIAMSLKRVNAIIVPSTYLAQVFEKYGFPTQIVPNVIDLERFTPNPTTKSTSGGPCLLVARNLEEIYGNANVLHAFALIRKSYPNARLIMAGSGNELDALKILAQELGVASSVEFPGRVDNHAMIHLYRVADIVLNPSLADNMPISLLEALACALPIVSTNVGGIPFLLEHEATALLVAPNDPEAMARATLSLLNDPQKAARISAAGCAHIRRFSWDQIAPRLQSQYRRVVREYRSGWYASLVAVVLFPLQEVIKRHNSGALLREMERSQWWTTERIEQFQLERLRTLLIHAQMHVPYYREQFFKIGFDPQQVRSLADLTRLPLLGKMEIRAGGDALKSLTARDLKPFSTGGSNGEPLTFFLGKERVSHDVAAKRRATRWWGVDVGDREIVVWGSPIELNSQDMIRLLRDYIMRSVLLPAFDMSNAKLDQFIEYIHRYRPKMLFGYPSALGLIASHARARNISLNNLKIRVACVTSERLYDEQRELIAATFGCKVANGYGGRDAGFIAHECPEGGMHITAEDIIVEIVDTKGQPVPVGTSGSIVITHLATKDFPFIRYITGDVGALGGTCSCGRGLPLLKHIEGRSTDFVMAQDGTVLHGLALIYIIRELAQVRAFKIIQENLNQTRVLLVTLPALAFTQRAQIESQFKARLGEKVEVIITEVDEIAPEASGKFRYVVSKVMAHEAPIGEELKNEYIDIES